MEETETTVIETPNRFKSFIARHKTAITITATSTVWIALHRHALAGHNEFLKEKGLYDEFYAPTEEQDPS